MPFKKISFSLIFLIGLVPFFSLSGAGNNRRKTAFQIGVGTAAVAGAHFATKALLKPEGIETIEDTIDFSSVSNGISEYIRGTSIATYNLIINSIKNKLSNLYEHINIQKTNSSSVLSPEPPVSLTADASQNGPVIPEVVPSAGPSVGSPTPTQVKTYDPFSDIKKLYDYLSQGVKNGFKKLSELTINKKSQSAAPSSPSAQQPAKIPSASSGQPSPIPPQGALSHKKPTLPMSSSLPTQKPSGKIVNHLIAVTEYPTLKPGTSFFEGVTTIFRLPFQEIPKQLREYASAAIHQLREVGSTLVSAYDAGHLSATVTEWFSTPSDTMSPLQKKILVGAIAGYVIMSFMKKSSDTTPASVNITDIQSQDQDKEIGRYELSIDILRTAGTTTVVAQGTTITALKNDFIEKMGAEVTPGERELVLSIASKITYKNAHYFQGPTNLPAQKNVCPLETQPLPVYNMPVIAGHVTTPGQIRAPAVLISVSLGNFFDAKILPRITSHYERFPTTVIDDQKTTYKVVMVWDRSDSYRIVKFLKNSITFGKFGDFTASSLAELKKKMLVELADNYLTYREGNLLIKISAHSPNVYPGTFALSTIKVTMPPMTIPGPPLPGGVAGPVPAPQARISDAESGLVRRWTTDMLTKGIADWRITYRNERERLAQEIWNNDFAPHLPPIIIPESSWFLSATAKAAALAGIGYWSFQQIQNGHYKAATASLPLFGIVGLGLWQQLIR